MTLLLLVLAASTASVGQCGLCHSNVRVEFETSVHAHERMGCVECHGGDPEAIDVDKAHSKGFKKGLTRFQIPELCASCHSNPQMMRPYNLSTEQYALYQTSQHGIRLAAGDPRVATCIDCHGVHDIRRPREPASKVFPRHVPETCGACHGDPALMARYDKDITLFDSYMKSRHADELLNQGNLNAPNCANCHGVHGATPPGVGDVDKVCGGCHSSAREAYLAGPHGTHEHGSDLPECVSCHGSHEVGTAVRGQIADACSSCHGGDSAQQEIGAKMDALFSSAGVELENARAKIEEARRVPLYTDDYEARLQEAQTYLVGAEPTVHSLSIEETERMTDVALSIGEEIQAEIQGELSDLRFRRIGLVIFWFYLVLTIAIIARIRQKAMARKS